MDIQNLKNELLRYNEILDQYTDVAIVEIAKYFSSNEIFFFIGKTSSFTTEGKTIFIEPILFLTSERILFFSTEKNQVVGQYSSRNISKVTLNESTDEFEIQCIQPGYKQSFKLKTTNREQLKTILKENLKCNIQVKYSTNSSPKTNTGTAIAILIIGFILILGLAAAITSSNGSSITTNANNSQDWIKKIEKKAVEVTPIAVNGELAQVNVLLKYYSPRMFALDIKQILEETQKATNFNGLISFIAQAEFVDIYGKKFQRNVIRADFHSSDIREVNFKNIKINSMVLAHASYLEPDSTIKDDIFKYCIDDDNHRFASELCKGI